MIVNPSLLIAEGGTIASPDAQSITKEFFISWTTGDVGRARGLLHRDLSCSGPIGQFDGADAYVRALRAMAPVIRATEEQMVFVDGNDVCMIYDLVTNVPAEPISTAEWYHLRGHRISSVRTFCDPRTLLLLMEDTK